MGYGPRGREAAPGQRRLINKEKNEGEASTAPWTSRRKGAGLRPRAGRRALAPAVQARAPHG